MNEMLEKIVIAAAIVTVLYLMFSGPDQPTGYTGSLWEEVQTIGDGR